MEEALQPAALQLDEATRDFAAGAAAGMAGVVAGQPLDVVRIRQQQRGAGGGGAAAFLRGIVWREGAASLWRGTSYPLATAALQNAVCFQAYGAASRFLAAADQQLDLPGGGGGPPPLSRVFWAGCFAGAVQTAVVAPVDLLKIRLQLQTAVRGAPGYVGPVALLRRLLRAEGLPGLYRGMAITAIRDFPSHGVYFASYEAAVQALPQGWAPGLWAAGGLAGAVSWLSVYPFDVIKSRVQAASAGGAQYQGWMDCAVRSYREEGAQVFVRGLPTTLGRAFIVNGAIFTVYEAVHTGLGGGRRAQQATDPA